MTGRGSSRRCSRAWRPAEVPAPDDWDDAVLKVLACPDMASKRWIWEQYDRHVMADTLQDSATGADAGRGAGAWDGQGPGRHLGLHAPLCPERSL